MNATKKSAMQLTGERILQAEGAAKNLTLKGESILGISKKASEAEEKGESRRVAGSVWVVGHWHEARSQRPKVRS